MKILFLEDNPGFIDLILTLCRSKGDEIVHTDSIVVARKLFSKSLFDLVICDLHLAGSDGTGGSGLALITHIRRRSKKRVPIVVITGLELISFSEVKSYGVDLVLNKPLGITLDEFYEKLTVLKDQMGTN